MIFTPLYGHTILHAHAPLTLAHSHSHTSSYLTTHPFTPAQVMLNKEVVIRQLYRSEVLWLVYCCQSRALGKRITAPELPVGDAAGREGRGGEGRGEEGGCCWWVMMLREGRGGGGDAAVDCTDVPSML